jgi:serine/threonine protein phosphatase PrpC
MEDRYNIVLLDDDPNPGLLVVVCDGHGGARCANFVSQIYPMYFEHIKKSKPTKLVKTWLKQALVKTIEQWDDICFNCEKKPTSPRATKAYFDNVPDSYYESQFDSGTTLSVLYIQKTKRKYHILNLGDSRVVAGWTNKWHITKADKPKDKSYLLVTHSIGDNDSTLTGEVKHNPSYYSGNVTKKSEFIVATDGLWDNLHLDYSKHIVTDELMPAIQKVTKTKTDDNIVIVHIKI